MEWLVGSNLKKKQIPLREKSIMFSGLIPEESRMPFFSCLIWLNIMFMQVLPQFFKWDYGMLSC